ncbi:MAG: alcohol dehydrogenase [Hyphomicrobiales bacterium]|nr:alcohol dehydrogenase [Hyphomicrobiales bacterium]
MNAIPAAVSYEVRATQVRELPFPDIPEDAGLLKVELCGICGSDWPHYNNYPRSKGPLILGHETVGFVERMGRYAGARFGVKEGDRVALEEYLPCGHCRFCRTGDFRLCDATDTLNRSDTIRFGSTPVSVGPGLWGGYAQYKYLHPNSVFHHMPAHVPARLATLALPLGNGVEWSCLQGGLKIGEAVVIQGPGQQGLACAVAAREAGAAIVIVTGRSTPSDRKRLELALQLGATHVIDIDNEDLFETVAEITGGEMADLVMDCSSGGPAAAVSAVRLARKRGRIILGGRSPDKKAEFDTDILVRKFLTVKGVRGHSWEAVELAIQIIASGKHPLERMCTHVFPLARTHDALMTVGGLGEPDAIHCSIDPWA